MKECSSFTYLADGSACYLLRSSCLASDFNTHIPNTFHYEKMDIAGFSHMRTDACLTHHYENALDVRLLNLRDCARACEIAAHCPGFSYQPSETRCFLHATTCSPSAYPDFGPKNGEIYQAILDTYAFIKLGYYDFRTNH